MFRMAVRLVAKISALDDTMRSRLPKRSRCTGPMAARIDTDGLTQRVMAAISPGPNVPISATNTSVPATRCSLTVRHRPAVLLKLAGVATTERVPVSRCRR